MFHVLLFLRLLLSTRSLVNCLPALAVLRAISSFTGTSSVFGSIQALYIIRVLPGDSSRRLCFSFFGLVNAMQYLHLTGVVTR